MSLPSKAIFYNKDKEVCHEFVNCGWFLNRQSLIRLLREMKYPDSKWDKVFLYGSVYEKKEIKILLKLDELFNEFWKIKFKNWNERERKNYNNEIENLILPKINKLMPKLIASEIVDVQPLGNSKENE